MEIESNVKDLFGKQQSPDVSGDARNSLKDKWLAALEQQSFRLSDDRLLSDKDAGKAAADRSVPDLGSAERQRPASTQSLLSNIAAHDMQHNKRVNLSLPSVAGPVGLKGNFPGEQLPGVSARSPANNPHFTRNPGRPGISMTSPAFAQRYEALVNQTRFMDVNIQIIQSKDGLTLWIRDFKQKYSNEVFHWTKSLENLLREKGQSLSRIMLNGKNLSTINAIFGGKHGN